MIHAVLIFNNHGKPRLTKFFTPQPHLSTQSSQSHLLSRIFGLVSDRTGGLCNFLDAPGLDLRGSGGKGKGKEDGGEDQEELRIIYRHYATLYFVFVVDGAESELGILDLIQVFVESLDRSFENVCELDLIFHFDEVLLVLAEIIQGGLVLETNINEIASNVHQASALRRQSASSTAPLLPSSIAASFNNARGGGGGGGRSGGVGGGMGDQFRGVAGRFLSGLGAA